ncbi:MAG TPA: glycosyltransferase family 39 protein [Acidimicrobiales bacterium]
MRTLVATESDEGETDDGETPPEAPSTRVIPTWLGTLSLVGLIALGVGLRFVSTSSLWLDEALSVNISALPVGDLLEQLRHDGHPPLYYLLLHYWMAVFGEGDAAVRALSGVIGVATLPLAWVAGRRLAGTAGARWALLVVAISPYCVRYSTETRMYALVMLLVLAGYLLVTDALGHGATAAAEASTARPTWPRLVGIAVVSGLLLLSHYWAIWLLGAVGLLLLAHWWTDREARPSTLKVIVAVAAGGLFFLPWVPSFLYQAEHTGTPWAGPMRPGAIVAVSLSDLGGGINLYEAALYGLVIVTACLLALFLVRARGAELVLDLRTTPLVRPLLTVTATTIVVGAVMAYPTSATFQSRYAAVVVPLVLVAAGVGVSRLPGVPRMALGGLLVGLSLLGLFWNLYYERTQAGQVGEQVAAHAQPGDIVLTCPDQLGPAFSREIPDGVPAYVYPTLEGAELVDWVDYADRQAAADPAAIAEEVRRLADGHDVYLVWRDSYETFGDQCQQLRGALGEGGDIEDLVAADTDGFYETAYLSRISPAAPGTVAP